MVNRPGRRRHPWRAAVHPPRPKSGTAINEADNLWDLFPEEGNKKKVVGTATVIE
jgi:hypothetical protein